MKIETINENYNVTLTISNEVGDKLYEAKTNTNTIQDIDAMTGDNALMEFYNAGLREIKRSNFMKTETKYKLEDVEAIETTATTGNIIGKFDEFLYRIKNSGTLYCGPKIYKYIQMSSKYKVESNENNLEFPVLFGTWVNGDQKISLYLSPDKCKDDEFIIES
jgi:hypothetical protein